MYRRKLQIGDVETKAGFFCYSKYERMINKIEANNSIIVESSQRCTIVFQSYDQLSALSEDSCYF